MSLGWPRNALESAERARGGNEGKRDMDISYKTIASET